MDYFTYRSNKPPAYPLFVPVNPNTAKKGRFRPYGKRDPMPIELKLATAPRTASAPEESLAEIALAPWEREDASNEFAHNAKTLAILRDAELKRKQS